MPIEGGLRDKLEPGTVLSAKYKGTEYRATVVEGDEGKVRYRLEDGYSAVVSSAASALSASAGASTGSAAFADRVRAGFAFDAALGLLSRDLTGEAGSSARTLHHRHPLAALPSISALASWSPVGGALRTPTMTAVNVRG